MPPVSPALNLTREVFETSYSQARSNFEHAYKFDGYAQAMAMLWDTYCEFCRMLAADPDDINARFTRARRDAMWSLYQQRVQDYDCYCPPGEIPF